MRKSLFKALLKSVRQMSDIIHSERQTKKAEQETEYLLSSPANAKRLLDSVARINKHKNTESK